MYTINLDKVGNEVMLALPSAILDQVRLQAGARIGISVDHGRLLIEPYPRSRPRYRLDDLLAQCDPSAEMTAEDRHWLNGEPVGNELL